MSGGANTTCDGFLDGRLQIRQPANGYRAGTDAVLLAASVRAQVQQSVFELGCGVGVASLCLAARISGLEICGVELQKNCAALARENARANRQKFDVRQADLAKLPADILQKSFDHVIVNPPFYKSSDGTPARNSGKEQAFRETLDLQVWLDTAVRRLKPGAWMTLIQLTERLPDVLLGLQRRLGDVEIKPIVSRKGRAPERFILRGKKASRGEFRLHTPLIMHAGDSHAEHGNRFTSEVQGILRDGNALNF